MKAIAFYPGSSEDTSMCAAAFYIVAAVSMTVVAVTSPYADQEAMAAAWWALLPAVGALLASSMAFLLNKVSENPRAVLGRIIGAVLLGVGIPRSLTYVHPKIQTLALDPILLVSLGFLCGLFGYAAAAYLVDKFFSIAPSLVDKQMDRLDLLSGNKPVDKDAKTPQT